MNKLRFPSLNGLRAISVLMVVINHLNFGGLDISKFPIWLKPFLYLIGDGTIGVNIFFVISGFLITSLMIEEELHTGTISLKKFYIRRTLRIFPAYYFMLLIYFILQICNYTSFSPMSWLTSLTYTKYFNNGLDRMTSHAWSLSIEEQFYLFWPLIFTFGNKVRKIVAWVLFFIVPIVNLYVHYFSPGLITDVFILKRIDAIATGCLLALYKDRILHFSLPRFKFLFYIGIFDLLFMRYIRPLNSRLDLHLDYFVVAFAQTTFSTVMNLGIGVIILYSVWGSKGIWFKLLNTRVFEYIGTLSYGIYLWQQIFTSGLYWYSSLPVNLVFIFAAAMLSHYCIEKPFLKLKEKFSHT